MGLIGVLIARDFHGAQRSNHQSRVGGYPRRTGTLRGSGILAAQPVRDAAKSSRMSARLPALGLSFRFAACALSEYPIGCRQYLVHLWRSDRPTLCAAVHSGYRRRIRHSAAHYRCPEGADARRLGCMRLALYALSGNFHSQPGRECRRAVGRCGARLALFIFGIGAPVLDCGPPRLVGHAARTAAAGTPGQI